MYLLQGTELNHRYVIESLLGHGGFGITYAAHDKVLNVRVAIKEYLPRQLATRGEGQTKVSVFTGEARQQYDYGLRQVPGRSPVGGPVRPSPQCCVRPGLFRRPTAPPTW